MVDNVQSLEKYWSPSQIEIDKAIAQVVVAIEEDNFVPTKVIGIERGGIVPAQAFARHFCTPLDTIYVSCYDGEKKRDVPIISMDRIKVTPSDCILIVDDLVDSGGTVSIVKQVFDALPCQYRVAVLYKKPHSLLEPDYVAYTTDRWVIFPWEQT